MAKQAAKTPEQNYARKGVRKALTDKGKSDSRDASLSGRMAAAVIEKIPKDYDPWENNDFSEDDFAEDIVENCGRYIRYCDNEWIGWNAEDGCWKGEEHAESMVQWIVRHFGRLMADVTTEDMAQETRFVRRIRSSGGIKAVMEILKHDKRICVTRDQFDTDPAVLNCKGDLYNLRTGEVRPVEPEDYITKSAFCKPAKAESKEQPALPPLFLDFIRKITSKDGVERQDLAKWIMFYFGYSLTGETGASFFANFYGGGQNGKSVLLKLMMSIFGDYAAPINQDIVIENRFASPFILAGLPGIRLGVLADSPEGQLNMKLIKEITTSEPTIAPVKFKKDFTLRAVLKLAVGSNFKLTLKNTGMDVRRRVRLVPFDYTVPDEEIVPDLEKKLLEEAPEILRMLIYFAGQYYKKGGGAKAFPKCEIIDEASKEYIESQDLVGRWVSDKTEACHGNEEKADDLYRDFRKWCEEKEKVRKIMGKNKFGDHLSFHVKDKKRTNKEIIYLNIRLLDTSPPLPDSGSG